MADETRRFIIAKAFGASCFFLSSPRLPMSWDMPCYVIGGYVRDIFLQRATKDIDVVTVGSGIEWSGICCKIGKTGVSLGF